MDIEEAMVFSKTALSDRGRKFQVDIRENLSQNPPFDMDTEDLDLREAEEKE